MFSVVEAAVVEVVVVVVAVYVAVLILVVTADVICGIQTRSYMLHSLCHF